MPLPAPVTPVASFPAQHPYSVSRTGSVSSTASSRSTLGSPSAVKRSQSASCNVSVQVAVRIKPRQRNSVGESAIADCTDTSVTVLQTNLQKRKYVFDKIFDDTTTQQGVFDYVEPGLQRFLAGFNVCVMAYGQSGSGKTYTMGTDASALNEHSGIIPRVLSKLFEHGLGAGELSMSFVEIYKEQFSDLLSPSSHAQITVREDGSGIHIVGLRQVPLTSFAQALDMLRAGSRQRQTNSTDINDKSSRSHAVCSLHLTREIEAGGALVTSKFNLVDLAGSERMKAATGSRDSSDNRAKEGISINSGLTALGKVITQLASPTPVHVSYRDSKLTRILQDSLGGNAYTYLIACVPTESSSQTETNNTLSYAFRARSITSTPQIIARESQADLERKVKMLTKELEFWRSKGNSGPRLSDTSEFMNDSTSTLVPISPTSSFLPDESPKLFGSSPVSSPTSRALDSPVNELSFFRESGDEMLERTRGVSLSVESMVKGFEETIEHLQTSLKSERELRETESEESAMCITELAQMNSTLEREIAELKERLFEQGKDFVSLKASYGAQKGFAGFANSGNDSESDQVRFLLQQLRKKDEEIEFLSLSLKEDHSTDIELEKQKKLNIQIMEQLSVALEEINYLTKKSAGLAKPSGDSSGPSATGASRLARVSGTSGRASSSTARVAVQSF